MQASGLTIRQYERSGIRLPVELVVRDQHRAQIRFSSSSAAENDHMIRGIAADISAGGMGLELRYFLPRNCEMELRLLEPVDARASELSPALAATQPPPPPSPAKAAGEGVSAPLLVQRVRVRRVQMTSGEPSYAIGVAFIDPPDDIEARIADLFKRFARRDAPGGATGPAPKPALNTVAPGSVAAVGSGSSNGEKGGRHARS